MHTIPPSARTIAPPSSWNSPELASLITEAVSPAAELPLPLVYTEIGAHLSTNFRNYDLATDGSPKSRTLISPLNLIPSGSYFGQPPNMRHAIAFLISGCPNIEGSMLLLNLS